MELDAAQILAVERVDLDGPSSSQQWPCAACGSWHEIGRGFVVHHADSGLSQSAYVCPNCAAPYVGDT